MVQAAARAFLTRKFPGWAGCTRASKAPRRVPQFVSPGLSCALCYRPGVQRRVVGAGITALFGNPANQEERECTYHPQLCLSEESGPFYTQRGGRKVTHFLVPISLLRRGRVNFCLLQSFTGGPGEKVPVSETVSQRWAVMCEGEGEVAQSCPTLRPRGL